MCLFLIAPVKSASIPLSYRKDTQSLEIEEKARLWYGDN